ncbi:MAG TPA: hypothetical protein VHY08_12225 [Bacillota bacterium]|nr:hypothetical protein [Bacillota bacterium]
MEIRFTLTPKKDANPALTENRNNPSQLVEDNSHSLLGIDGRLKFDPGASQVNTNIAPPGGITVDLATNTGIRANFKLDNGSLQFNFSLVRITPTQQVAMVDKIGPGQDGPTVNRTQNTRASRTAEEIHFKGEIISSVDDEGNRVIELKGNITDQGLGALLANNLEGLQMEEGKAEIDINGKLTVTQKTVSEGSKTTYKSTAHAEMELYKVVEQEDQGANLKTLTPLNTTDGFRAGLIADQSALHFNFGVFILGISLVG